MHQALCLEQERPDLCPHKACGPAGEKNCRYSIEFLFILYPAYPHINVLYNDGRGTWVA